MNKNKIASYLFMVLGVLVIAGSCYLIYLYGIDIMSGIVEFIAKNNIEKLKSCGVTVPSQFSKITADLPMIVIPFYLGVIIFVSFLMFFAGYYYNRGKSEEDKKKKEEMEKEMVHRLVKQIEDERGPSKSQSRGSGESSETDEPSSEVPQVPEESEESAPEEGDVEEKPEQKPRSSSKLSRRK